MSALGLGVPSGQLRSGRSHGRDLPSVMPIRSTGTIKDYRGRHVRLTEERWRDVAGYPEMRDQAKKLRVPS